MTPKEKAQELVDKFYQTTPNETCFSPEFETGSVQYKAWEQAKQCALIAVDEILNNNNKIPGVLAEDTIHNTLFWQEVKQEIEKL